MQVGRLQRHPLRQEMRSLRDGVVVKFRAWFKTPDAATYETFLEQAEAIVMRENPDAVLEFNGIDHIDHIDPEREDLVDRYNELAHEMATFARRWVEHGELIGIEFDTETGTARPVTRKP